MTELGPKYLRSGNDIRKSWKRRRRNIHTA